MKTNTGNVCAKERYGCLVTIRLHGHNKEGRALWECQCDCGKIKIALSKTLRNGTTRSCGCIRTVTPPRLTHGKSNTAIYYCWRNMLNRCYYKPHQDYKNYGGRGIGVCSKWRKSFECFYGDMGELPFSGATIERRDNNRGYSPNNCYWATRSTQARNRRNAVTLSLNGQRRSIKEWAMITGLKPHTIEMRLRRPGWNIEQVLFAPLYRRK